MPRIAYLDTFSGLSGDMTLGALIDCGLSKEALLDGLRSLPLEGYRIEAEKVHRGPFHATRVRVVVEAEDGRRASEKGGREHRHEGHHHHHDHHHDHHHHDPHSHGAGPAHEHPGGHSPHRHLEDIRSLIARSGLPEAVKRHATAVFERLAEAEARVHGQPVETVHFHEVGAVDSIVDIAGSCLGLHLLGVEEVWCSRATVGTGTVRAAHGEIPLPAPATLELLRGRPLIQRETGFELTTPTGAALATTLARGFGPMPAMTVDRIGYGAGDDRPGPVPNVLRLVLGERAAAAGSDRVVLLETNVDDMSPQWLAYLGERLLEAGALDVWVLPVQMKKSRPAHEVRVLAPPASEEALAEILFRETTTFGLRRTEVDRLVLDRSMETVSTPWGEVRIKVGRRGGKTLSASPEYEDVQRAARAGGVPLKEVHRRALEEYHRRAGGG